jgi:uncharacterized protein involved in exopolysaccharide biosynthesis
VILVVTAFAVASAYYLSLTTEPEYTARTTLVLDFGDAGPFDQTAFPRQMGTSYLATQVDIIKSARVARLAIANLEDADRAALAREQLRGFDASQLQSPEARQRLIDSVLGLLVVSTERDSHVITLAFTSADPQLAAAVANSFASAYIDTSLELAVEPARRNVEWFQDQIVTLRDRVAEKQAILTEYKAEYGIVSSDERLDTELNRYEALAEDLLQAQARTSEMRAGQLGREHPDYRRAVEQEQSVRALLLEQEARVFEAQKERDELELLEQDVEIASRTLDVVLQQFYESSMESQFNQTNVSVLNEANPPSRSSRPGFVSTILAAATFGLLLGSLLALAIELINRRVRTEEDIEDGTEVKVLATI